MPAYLSDGNASIYHTAHHVIDLDPARLGIASHKHISLDGSDIQPAARPDTTNASFDDTSSSTASSSSQSDLSDASQPVRMNGNRTRTRQTSMTSISNGQSVHPGLPVEHPKPMTNGSATLVDRTVPSAKQQALTTPQYSDYRDQAVEYQDDTELEATPTLGSSPFPAVDASSTYSYQQTTPLPVPNSIGSPTSSMPYHSPPVPPPTRVVTPASPPTSPPPIPTASLEVAPSPRTSDAPAPHRLSSPPQYNPSNSSPTLTTTQQPPGPGQLRQRHTLEVPRKQPRGSKDGPEAAFASGRFSPTASGGPGPALSVRRASLSLARRATRSIQSDFPRDEIAPDEDALHWAEVYRQKRASKKRRREEEDDDRVLVGTKVDEHHVNWVTAYNMLTGIRVSVSRTNAKLDRELTDADFEAKQKSTFDIAGNELVPSAKYDFKFKDYAPWVFRRLRALFRLDPADYLMSLTGKYILSELGSPGKSGSFFYFSRDYKYIIKTIHHAEHKFLRKILKDYYQHVMDNPNTLLSQFYGLHRVKMPYGKKIHFVVMNNLFPPHRDIHHTYDLKGSTVGRDYPESKLEENPRATLKDLNWLRRKRALELGIEKKRLFLGQLQRDVQLLKRLQIMDYSLLIGIHDLQKGNEENLRDKTLRVFNPGGERQSEEPEVSVLLRTPSKLENAKKARELRQMLRQERPVPMDQTASRMPDELDEGNSRSGFVFNQDDGGFRATNEDNTPADEVYYLGVIDCLTHYGVIKKIEHFWKGLSNDRTQISALPPDQYGDRFYEFVEGVTMSAQEAQRKELAEAEAARHAALAGEPAEEVHESHGVCPPWGSHHRSSSAVPAMPTYAPPPPPPLDHLPPNVEVANEKNTADGELNEKSGHAIRYTNGSSHVHDGESAHGQSLPVVDEAAEASSSGARSARSGRSIRSQINDEERPPTPRKDRPVTPHKTVPRSRGGPPTPPKYLKPESADSGYGGINGTGTDSREGSLRLARKISRDSLNKDLPPLPRSDQALSLSVG
ncbi:hypothetical protein jhhlp_002945 [Lomentospora prolificans]|uniref:1-phosphatidylinositol-4-phosphate 5-kinase n=1 Tax=Lomentospora prolificans TaxID=41688 RepID=A0A2N3NFH1_9PEZI|nr:hypothetical protein jhhlp_002945 [Lomentospora prolificans]